MGAHMGAHMSAHIVDELCAAQMFVARTRQALCTVFNSIKVMVRASAHARMHAFQVQHSEGSRQWTAENARPVLGAFEKILCSVDHMLKFQKTYIFAQIAFGGRGDGQMGRRGRRLS
jgi:hypothetical protein